MDQRFKMRRTPKPTTNAISQPVRPHKHKELDKHDNKHNEILKERQDDNKHNEILKEGQEDSLDHPGNVRMIENTTK
jgi:hypothetical protein